MSETKQFTREEVRARAAADGALFVIDNVVYDVGAFLDEHPGGHEVLLNVAGRDATEDFDDVGHSLDAKELMVKFRVGEVAAGERREARRRRGSWAAPAADVDAAGGPLASWKLPLVVSVLVTLLYAYLYG